MMRPRVVSFASSRIVAFFRMFPALLPSKSPISLILLTLSLFLVPALLAQEQSGGYAPNQGDQGYGQQDYPQSNPNYAQPAPYGNGSAPQQDYPAPNYPEQPYPSDAGPGASTAPQNYPPQDYPPQNYQTAQPLSEQQLEQLVAPIALYPDNLVAQVLAASTYPQQVAEADQWRRGEGYVPPDQIAAGANAQPWDPSVKALAAFPDVLAEMDRNLQWVTDLGNAYYNEPQDVLHSIQVMRWRAQAAGSLRSTPQEAVSYEQGNIVLAPENPQVVYVPEYNPWLVYGASVAPYPGFSILGAVGSFLGPAAIHFGWGVATAAFAHSPFGLLAWGLDWLAHSVLFNGSNFYSHSMTVRDWGFPHGGPRAFGRGGNSASWSTRSYRGSGGYSRMDGAYANSRWQGQRSYRAPQTSNRDFYARNRQSEQSRTWQNSPSGYPRQGFRSFNETASRPQPYSHASYSARNYNSGLLNRGIESGRDYGRFKPASSGSRANFDRGSFAGRSSRTFKGESFSRSSSKRGRSNEHFRGKEPKNFASAKSFSHGHSSGHGHSGGHSHGGKHHG